MIRKSKVFQDGLKELIVPFGIAILKELTSLEGSFCFCRNRRSVPKVFNRSKIFIFCLVSETKNKNKHKLTFLGRTNVWYFHQSFTYREKSLQFGVITFTKIALNWDCIIIVLGVG